jgi:hypothetical protein
MHRCASPGVLLLVAAGFLTAGCGSSANPDAALNTCNTELAAYVDWEAKFASGSADNASYSLREFASRVRPLASQEGVGDLAEWFTSMADYADAASRAIRMPYDPNGMDPVVDMPLAHKGLMKSCFDILGNDWVETVPHATTKLFLSRIATEAP